MKLKWKVDSKPTGRYASFQRRGWPGASYADGSPAVQLICTDEYEPGMVKAESHGPITIQVADYSVVGETFKWRTVKSRAANLKQAKELALRAIEQNPQIQPKTK